MTSTATRRPFRPGSAPVEREAVTAWVGAEIVIGNAPGAFGAELVKRCSGSRKVPGRTVTYETISLAHETAAGLALPRGAVEIVRKAAEKYGIRVDWRSGVTGRPEDGFVLHRCAIDLRPYQDVAVNHALTAVQSMIVLNCAGGKTTIGAATLASLGLPALVLAPTVDIVGQWERTLARAGGGIRRVRVLRDVKPESRWAPLGVGEVAVATPGSFRGDPSEDRVLRTAAVLVADEAHRAASASLTELIRRCPARWRLGLTATPDRADGMGWSLPLMLGPMFRPATVAELVAGGWLVLPRILPLDSGWTMSASHRIQRDYSGRPELDSNDEPIYGTMNWSSAAAELAASKTRETTLMRVCQAATATGRRGLVLLPTKALAKKLSLRLKSVGLPSALLTGNESDKVRDAAVADLRAGRISIVLATTVADEGLDVPELDLVVLGAPGRNAGRSLQRVGRTMRPGGRPPIVVDVVDGGREFRAQWAARRKGYAKELGEEVIASKDPMSLDAVIAALEAA